jgi:hypothetical protein
MAGFNQIATSVTILQAGLIGYQGISLTDINSSSASLIASGSAIEIGGANFLASSDITPNASSFTVIVTGYSAYIGLVASGTAGSMILTASYYAATTYTPYWSTSKQGWYSSSASLIRFIGGCTKINITDSGGKYLFKNGQLESNDSDNVQYDLIIDSNADLDAWCQCISGQYKRVLIKSGAWTASSLSPTAGVLINLDLTGTTYVFAEKGSSINYSGAYSGTMYGLYHATLSTTPDLEKFDGISVNITNTATGPYYAIGFNKCVSLVHCYAITNSSATGASYISSGFSGCAYLVNCYGKALVSGTAGASANGFNSCNYLTNCVGIGDGSSSPASNSNGFNQCGNIVNCTGTGTTGSSGSGYGFRQCNGVSLSVGTGVGNSGTGGGCGFVSCVGVVLCQGVGTAAGSGLGYGFNTCTKMQQNKPNGASKTATYITSYADSGSSNACADTAAGGYNS